MSAATEPTPMVLAPSLDLTAAEELCRALQARLPDGDIVLDGASVENVSTPCLQVLAAAAASAAERTLRFRLREPSAVLRAAITDLGLHAAIPLED